MALDLFLHPRKTTLESLRDPAYKPTAARLRTQSKALKSLLARHPECRLVGDTTRGHVEGFRGELDIHPGYLHWCLHGDVDSEAVLALIVAFEGDGWTCTDPQDAGFGSDARSESRLQDWDELIGASFVGMALMRDWGARLVFDFTLADGRPLRLDFMHFGACQLPELASLLKCTVAAVTHATGHFDTLRLDFDDLAVIEVQACVPNGGVIGPKPRRR